MTIFQTRCKPWPHHVIPSPLHFGKMSKTPPASLASTTQIPHNFLSEKRFHSPKLSHGAFQCNGPMKTGSVAVACGPKMGPRDENKAIKTVLHLYRAIKDKNNRHLSDIIAEECLCVSSFVSAFGPFLGKEQVLAFFEWLMKRLGNNIEFVVQQTLDDGMIVSVSWKLEWNKVPWPLGKGISLHICHVYQGKVMIKNVEIFMEPILDVEPLRLKVLSMVTKIMKKLKLEAMFEKKRRGITVLLLLIMLAVVVIYLLRRLS